ncbi:Fc.00g061400.m01.CDS01 [Cosmosporella sp. VM-42]
MVLGGRRFDAYARATHELEKSVNRLREIDQLARLQRVESRLNKFDKMLRIMGTVSEEGLKDILENLKAVKESGSTQESYERQNNLEEVQKELHSMLGPSKGRSFTLDPLCFPFVIPSRTPNVGSNVVAQLKLDTGAVDNWIRTSILEKANIDYERMEYTKTFIGAGGAQFSPLGQVKITWCSENQALTRESLFLVHDQLPFDVILGFDYIVGSLSELSEPVLPLRHRLSKDDYQELQNSQLRKRASNQQIINLQKAQDAKEREEKRLLKAATRAATAAPSVLGTSAHGSLFPPGTPVYGTSSRSSSVFNIPATMPVISEPEQSSVNPSSIATSQQDGESFTTASSSVTQYQPSYVQPHVSDGEDEVEK